MTNALSHWMLLSQCVMMVSVKFASESRYLKLMWDEDWVKVPVVETIQRVVCESMNCVFVGPPLCA